jgi:N-acetylmuramoyl-L-alanine amidase
MRNIGGARRAVLRLLAGGISLVVVAGIAAARAPRSQPQPHPRPLVVIDPGHGGIDPGAISPSGVYEKDITFAVATRLASLLAATRDVRVVLSRSADEYVPLRERLARARALHADLLLSIHADALPDAAMRGLSVFTLSATASDQVAAALASDENRETFAGLRPWRGAREVQAVLIDLALRQTENLSLDLAHQIVESLGSAVVLLEHPQRSAGFVVLTAPDVPSVLVELGCLSNPVEEHLLQQPSYRGRLARGLADAVKAYLRRRGYQIRAGSRLVRRASHERVSPIVSHETIVSKLRQSSVRLPPATN